MTVDTALIKQAALDLAALGVYDQDEAQENAFARILVMGPPKTGKTTAILTSASAAGLKPFVINCDGDSCLKFPKKQGAKFLAKDCTSPQEWKACQGTAEKLVEAGECRLVLLDTATTLADNLLRRLRPQYDDDTRAMYGELLRLIVDGCHRIMRIQAHVILVAHIPSDFDATVGILPAIAGSSKEKIAGVVDDWAFFEVDTEANPPRREFVMGIHKRWGRNLKGKNNVRVKAEVPALFAELGISL